ncbi:hypothetical protein E3J74_02335 [Candidatus Bathyarchaeota archaeon]|nr:MAG: hypothetical protein E3J74_02335 [Candidatus Bathyarchaeota archaeon]
MTTLKIVSLKIRNFRSFGDESAEITFGDGANIIVGENNVGKSTILKCLDLLKGEYNLTPNDYHKGERNRDLCVEANVQLNDAESQAFIDRFLGSHQRDENVIQELSGIFGNVMSFGYSSKRGLYLQFGELYIRGDGCQLVSELDRRGAEHVIQWDAILQIYLKSDKSNSLLEIIKNRLTGGEKGRRRIHFRFSPAEAIRNSLRQKAKNFSEIRETPKGTGEHVLESYGGGRVADVLYTLKMSVHRYQRAKWRQIQKTFNELFHNLKLEVVKESKEYPPIIVVDKTSIKYEVPIEFLGAGIGEIITFLTHLIASKDMIFGLDMPELHFHPHAQRLLCNIIHEQSEKNQFLITTHSPTFIESRQIENAIVVREIDGETKVAQLPPKHFDDDDRLRLFRQLDTINKDFFFSRRVLIVEGPTETGAMPILSKELNKDFDECGISLVETGKFFGTFLRLLKGFSFPYLVMCDRDALMNIEKSINVGKRKVKTSPVLYSLWISNSLTRTDKRRITEMERKIQLIRPRPRKEIYPDDLFEKMRKIASKHDVYILPSDFEGVFERDGYGSILRKAKKMSKSKVIRGRYVAEQIVEKGDAIPKEFREVIERITEK